LRHFAVDTPVGHRRGQVSSWQTVAPRARRFVRFAFLATALAFPAMASAAIGVNKTFNPTNVSAGQTSTLTVILINNNAAAATGAAFTDNFPGSVVVAATPNASTTCVGGAVTATPGAASFAIAGGTIPAAVGLTAGTCTVQVDVQSPTSGVYINTIPASAVASSQGSNAQNASATLTVAALRPATGAKSFNPTVLHGSTSLPLPTSRVTLTLTNPNGVALTGATLTDTLPATLAIAPVPNTATTCGGGTVTTAAASATLSGGTIPANGNCTVQFDVVAANSNAYSNGNVTNTIAAGALTTTQGVTNAAAFSANVTLQTGARVEKSFVPASIVTGGTATLTVTVRNFNVSPLVNSIAFTDPLPGTMRVATPVTTSTTCAGLVFIPAPAAGDASFSVNNGSLAGATVGVNSNANCTVSIAVTATNAAANPVTLTNTIPVGTFGGVGFSSAGAGLIVTQLTSVGGSKSFSPSTILQGQVTTLTITLTNASASPATITSFTDALTTLAASPQFTVAAAPAATTTCGGALTATPGTTSITLGVGNVIPANGSCQIVVPVQAAANATTGALTNTIAQGALVTNQGRTQTTITAPLTVNPVLSVAKAFAPATVAAGADTRLTITLTRAANATSLSGLAFSDTLPALHVVSATPNLVNNCGGTVTAAGNTISLAGGSLAGGAAATSCTILVNVTTPAGAGAATNTISANAVTSTEGFVNRTAASATITRVVTSVTVNKSFTPATVLVGGQSTLSINFLNTNANAQNLTAVALTDTLPIGMAIGSPLTTTNSCGGTLTAVVGGGSIALSNVTLNANSTCVITVKVVANASGNLTDTLPVGAFKSAQGVTNPLAAQATLAATGSADLSITKTDGVASVVPGTSTIYTIVAKNLGPNDVAGAGVVDNAPVGVTFTGWTCTATVGSACGAPSGSGNINQTVTLLNGGSATYTVTAAIAANATGSITNTATIVAPGTVIDTVPGNNTASDTNTLTPQVDIAIVKTGTASVNALGAITYTLAISNAGPSSANGATFSDVVPAGITGIAAVCGSPLGGAVCPGAVTVAGNNVNGAIPTLPPGGSVVITITGTAPANAASLTNTGTVAVPPGVTDTNPGNNSSSTPTIVNPVADVAVVKTGPASVNAAGTITYLLTISNAGPSVANGATFSDVVPAGITGVAAVCGSPLGGAACPGSVTVAGNIVSGIVPTLPAGGSVVITITGTAPASGPLANTAIVAPPSGTTDPVPGNNSSSVSTTISPVADVAVVKTGPATVNAAGAITYTLTISNNGPSAADGATFSDAVPAGITGVAAVCGTPLGGAACPGSVTVAGNNVSGIVPTLPKNGSVVITITGTAPANATSFTNTAIVSPPSGTTDPTPGNNSSSVPTTVTAVADLAITKTDGVTSVVPGTTTTYTIVATNNGPSNVTGATVADTLPAAIASATWTAVATGGATGFTASGSGSIADTVDMPVGSTITYTVVANVASSATGTLVNTASVSVPPGTTDPVGGNNSATDTNTLVPQVTLAVAKTDGSTTYTPGGTATYIVTVTNSGPSDAADVGVLDGLPPGLTLTALVTCTATGNATCAPVTSALGGTGFTMTGARIAAGLGNSLVFTVPVAFASSMTAPSITNTAAATDAATGATASGTDTNTLAPNVSLAVAKDDGSLTYTPGGTATYKVTITHGGLSDATNVTINDPLPAGVTLTASATCVAVGSANCGTVTGTVGQSSFGATGASIAAGPGNSLVFTAPVAFAASLATDPLDNTATATDVLSGATGQGTDSNQRAAQVTLAVTKDDGSPTYTPGGTATYVVTVANTGASDALNVSVDDTLPIGVLLTGNVTCAVTGSAVCGTVTGSAGQGAFNVVGARINAGASNTLKFTVPVAFASSLADNPLINTATVQDLASNATGSASDSNTLARQADLAITKDDGVTSVVPGGTTTYTIVATNAGPSDVLGAKIVDTLPAAIVGATWTAVATGGATGFTPSGAGNINDTVDMPAGSKITYTLVATISSGATGTLSNTASVVTPVGVTDPNPANNSATDTNRLAAQADLAITKTDGVTSVAPGGTTTYTIAVTNSGPSDVVGATVSDPLPAAITAASYTAIATGGATGFTASGAGSIADTVNMPAGSTITYTLVATISATATGTLANTATVTPPATVTDPNPGNNSATDTNTLAPTADLSISKNDGITSMPQGGSTTYTIVVANAGPSVVTGATVSDPMPAALATMTYTAVGGGGASGFIASGSGSINDTVTLPVGGTITYTVQATLNAAAVGTLANTATVTPPAGVTDPTPGNNSATDVNTIIPTPQADLGITKTDGSATYTPGATITYTIVASNAGPANVIGATVVDVLPAVVTGATWTCTGAGGGTCPASGTGNLNVPVNLPAGASVTFLLTGTISPSATGNLANTATVSVPPGVVDPNPANNSATDVNTPNAVAGLSIAKVADSPTYTPGGTGTYTVTVGNNGPSNAGSVSVTDNLPAGVTLTGTPTCVATGAATCGKLTGTAGSTVFTASGATIAAGASNRLVYTLPVHFAATMSANPLVNIVSANDPASQSVASSSASSTLVFPGPPPGTPIPVDNRWALALLVALILAGRLFAAHRRQS